MRREIAGSLALLVTCLSLTSCNRDGEVHSALAEIDSFTTGVVSRVETATNPTVGVDDAQKYLDSRKSEVIARIDALKGVRGYQVSEETKRKLTASLVDDASRVGNLQIKYVSRSMNDPVFKAKLDKLVKDYQALFTE